MRKTAMTLLALTLLAPAAACAEEGEDKIPVAPASSGAAVKEPARPMDMFEDADTDGNGVLSKQEFLGRAEAHFKEMDMDADGLVTQDEMRALTAKKRLQMQMMMKKHP